MISIIVPVFNANSYLKDTLDSILTQTYAEFELILVDDGSNDGSEKICDEYAQLDNRITVIHKQNEGASAARNKGIELAKGNFLTFIDADDLIETSYLDHLHKAAERNENADLIMQGMTQKLSTKTRCFKLNDAEYIINSDRYETFFNKIPLNDFSGPYCKLFKRSIILENNIKFNKNIIYAEDFDFFINYLFYCNTAITIPDVTYNYIMREGSVSSKLYPTKKEISGLNIIYDTFIKLYNKYPCKSLQNIMDRSIFEYIFRIIFSNYRFNYTTHTRLSNFKLITNDKITLFKQRYNPDSIFIYFIKYTLTRRHFKILDLMLKYRLS